jgi:hypothetical protein
MMKKMIKNQPFLQWPEIVDFIKFCLKRALCVFRPNVMYIGSLYNIFINFGSIPNFGEKIENFSQIKFHKIFSAVNPLEKLKKQFFSNLKFGKFF